MLKKVKSKVIYLRTSKIRISSPDEDLSWSLDGEFGGAYRSIELRNINRAIEIFVPEKCRYFGDAKSV